MKKLIISIVAFLSIILLVPNVYAEEKVPVYMLTKNGCPACEAALEYFTELANENPGLFDLVELEVFDSNWKFNSEDLQNMFLAIYDKIGEDTSAAATPTIVIGDYHTIGLPQDKKVVYDAIVAVRDAKEKVDIVKDLADYMNIDINQIRKGGTVKEEEKSGNYDAIIIIGIFVVLIGGFAGLIIASKK